MHALNAAVRLVLLENASLEGVAWTMDPPIIY